MSRRLKILHVLAGGKVGGAERFMERFVRFADSAKFENEFIFLYSGGVIQATLHEYGYKTRVLNWKSGFSLVGRFSLITILMKINPDVIHFHDSTPLVKCFVHIFLKNVPIIQTVHGITISSKLAKWGQTIDDQFIDQVLSNSEHTSREYSKTYHRPLPAIIKIYLGIDLHEYQTRVWTKFAKNLPLSGEGIRLIYLGRLEEYKGVLDLPVLAKALKAEGINNFVIKIVGDGPYQGQLMRLIKDLDVEDYLEYCGLQVDTIPFLLDSDILVFPSWWEEPLGLVLLEGMACGLAIVAYDSGAVSEVLSNVPCTRIVKKKDVNEMARAIKDIALNDYFPNIEENMKLLQDKFDICQTVSAIETIYTQSIHKWERQL